MTIRRRGKLSSLEKQKHVAHEEANELKLILER